MGNTVSFSCDAEYEEAELEIQEKKQTAFERKERKKNKVNTGMERALILVGCGSGSGLEWERRHQQLPDDLAIELLTRLSVKHLYQYKCVSKSWYSMISSPLFTEVYRSHHPNGGLLISILERADDDDNNDAVSLPSAAAPPPPPAQLRFYYSGLEEEEEPEQFFCRFMVPPCYCYEGVTQVVNGLACFYARNQVFLCNVCSGEIMRLPESEFREDAVQYNYYFGFDPINKLYKLLKWSLICRHGRSHVLADSTPLVRRGGASSTHIKKFILPLLQCRDYYRECEVLTLGRDSSWRKLEAVGACIPLMFETQSYLVDGFLYWLYGISGLELGCSLVGFDLNKETFGFIPCPPSPWPVSPFSLNSHRFAQFMGRLAVLLVSRYDCYLVIDTLEDKYADQPWTRHAIKWPSELGSCGGVVPIGNLPTGEILLANLRRSTDLANLRRSTENEEDSCTPIYSFDHKNNKLRRFLVGKFPPSLDLKDKMALTLNVSCLVEKVDSLDLLFRKGEQDGKYVMK